MNAAIADPRSQLTGAVLASDGEPVVADVELMLETPDRGVLPRAGAVAEDIPLLDRGDVVIIPLAWAPTEPDAELRQRFSALWRSVRSSWGYRNPHQMGIELPPSPNAPSRYADALVAAGARRADWWWIGDFAVVLVVQGPPIPAPMTQLSLHIVRLSTGTLRHVAPFIETAVDLSWSWADVVAAGAPT